MNTNTTRNSAFGILALISVFTFGGCSQKPASEKVAAKEQTAAPATEATKKPAAPSKHVAHAKSDMAIAEPAPRIACENCGVVVAVRESDQEGKGSGLGVIAGGVAGGLAGNQVGNGSGRDLATLAGIIGGAIAGNKIEEKVKKTRVYDVTVKMANGEERVLRYTTAPGVMAGDKIRIEGEKIVRQ